MHHVETLPLIVQPTLKNIKPSGGRKAPTRQVKKVQFELANISLHFATDPRQFDVFEKVIGLNKLISHIVAQTNL